MQASLLWYGLLPTTQQFCYNTITSKFYHNPSLILKNSPKQTCFEPSRPQPSCQQIRPFYPARTPKNNTKQHPNCPICSHYHLQPSELFHVAPRESPHYRFLLLLHQNFKAYFEMYCILLDAENTPDIYTHTMAQRLTWCETYKIGLLDNQINFST